MLAAGFLEAGEGVGTLSPEVAAGAGANLAFFHHVPQIVLAVVVAIRGVPAPGAVRLGCAGIPAAPD